MSVEVQSSDRLQSADLISTYSEQDLERIKTFLSKFQVTRPARQAEQEEDDEDNMEDDDDDLAINDQEGTLKYQDQLVSAPSVMLPRSTAIDGSV